MKPERDIAVLGGVGDYTAAIRAAQLGARVACIDRAPELPRPADEHHRRARLVPGHRAGRRDPRPAAQQRHDQAADGTNAKPPRGPLDLT